MNEKIELGDEVKDEITGFAGVAVARTQWLTGCDRITVRPRKVTKEGKIIDYETFDEAQLAVTKRKSVPRRNNDRGGPGDSPAKPLGPTK